MEELISLVFKEDLPSIEEIYKKYPDRGFTNSQKVTRVGPSPTGCVHIGTLYASLICERLAHTTNGVFFLRIEDTDTKREVQGVDKKIPALLKQYHINFDEGYNEDGTEVGNYGPYKQSEREKIYKAFIKELLKEGKAYPCFCTEEELESIVKQQKAQNCQRLGYYGNWAKYRNFPIEEAIKKIKNGEDYVIRFKSDGNFTKKVAINDCLKGIVEFPESDLDVVILKKNNLPTYHLAHVVDDHLMGTNPVIRGDEWLPSVPLHLQLFKALGWKAPQYAHISPILKIDETGSKRKLSKRKDPEANVEYFDELGYPVESIVEYLMNLANSNFEDWRKQNPTKPYTEFPFSLKKMNTSGALFDFVKLNSVSKEVIGLMKAERIYDLALIWAKKYNQKLFDLLQNNKEKSIAILNIERENVKKVRKDIAKWSDLENELVYFFELDSNKIKELLRNYDNNDLKQLVEFMKQNYDINDTNDEWFNKIKTISEKLNYATNIKEYKANPNNFKGSVSDMAKFLRIMITGKEQSPNLYEIMKILGHDESLKRLKNACF